MSKTLSIGDPLPAVSLPDQHNNIVHLKDYCNQHPLVIYFYPKDDTPGCTQEACSFRDHYEDFQQIGARVFGISSDSPRSHQEFISRYRLNFDLLSDRKKIAEKAFGVPRNLFGLIAGRVTFVFNKEGYLIHEFNSATNATRHIEEALTALKG